MLDGQTERARGSTELRDDIRRVSDRIAASATEAGRRPEDVTLLAVTKRKSPEIVRAAFDCGLRLFGENYVQEAIDKKAAAGVDAEWHLIGHLQSNKARPAVQTFSVIQSVDSEKTATSLSKAASECGIHQRILIQVRLGDEPTKSGIDLDAALELAATASELPSIAVEGLMGIAPYGVDPQPHFRNLRRVFDRLPEAQRQILSMGMSADFETAIREGATMVRVGSALFGART